MAGNMDDRNWKLVLVDIFMSEEEIDLSIVSEKWLLNNNQVVYPPSSIKGAKLETTIRSHAAPNFKTWDVYPCKVLKICGNSSNYFHFSSLSVLIKINLLCLDDWDAVKGFEKRKGKNDDTDLNTEKEEPSQRKRSKPVRYRTPSPTSSAPPSKVARKSQKMDLQLSSSSSSSSSSSDAEVVTTIDQCLDMLNDSYPEDLENQTSPQLIPTFLPESQKSMFDEG